MSAPPAIARLLLVASLLAACDGGGGDRRDEPPGLARAEAALESGRTGEAGRELAAIPPGSFGTAALRLRAARAHAKTRDWAAAARLLETDAGDFRRATDAATFRAEALLRSGALEDAERAIAVLGTVGTRPERATVLQAMAATARGNATDAGRDLEPLVRAGTRDPDVWVLWSQLALQEPAEAERRLLAGLAATGDRAPILAALGRVLLRTGEPGRALDHLREAARERPWDRALRVDLARARVASGRDSEMEAALEEFRRLAEDDPGDFAVALARAEATAEKGLRKAVAAGGHPGAGEHEFAEALRLYEDLAARPAPDAATAIAVLHGMARVLVETVPLDDTGAVLAPGSRLRRAEAILRSAVEIDPPPGRLRDAHGVLLLAEAYYLLGRGFRKAHAKDSDHTEAVGWYEKALAVDNSHLEALWDLALVYYDFLRTEDYIRKAARMAENHVRLRGLRGLPPLRPEQMKILLHIRELAAQNKPFPPGVAAPDPPKEKVPEATAPEGKAPEKKAPVKPE